MRIIDAMDIDVLLTALRVLAAVLTGAALLCLARVGPRFLAACLATALAVMALAVNSHWLKHLDISVESWARTHRSAGAAAVLSDIWNFMGNPLCFAAAVLTCGSWFSWRARSVMPATVITAAVGAGVAVENTLKVAVGRTAATVAPLQDRPRPGGVVSYLHSFPSGHVTAFGVFLGAAAVCLCAGRRLGIKVRVGVLAATGVASVGVLAVYSRAHTFTDVIGGSVLSAAVVAIAGPTLAASVARVRRPKAEAGAVHARTAVPLVRRDRVQVG